MKYDNDLFNAVITNYNGDQINGIPVITKLNVEDLEPGKIHRFLFKGAQMNIGQNWYVPVMVAKGFTPGKRILINTGIHGDELNGALTLQEVFKNINPEEISGAIIGVLQACPNSVLHVSRLWHLTNDGTEFADMNRIFPGKENGNTAEQHAYLLWNKLWADNVDFVVDLHSQSTDTSYPLFVYADYSIPEVKIMAELIPADQIKIDSGEIGSVETSFNNNHIPALTLEIGQGRSYEPEYVSRAVEGILNILIHLNIIKREFGRTANSFGSYIGDEMYSIRAETGGYSIILVTIGEMVKKGQKVAQQRNPFGDVIKEYYAPISGKVLSIGTAAIREAGALLVRILR